MFITLKTPRNIILIEPCSQNMFVCSSLMIVDDRIFEIKKNNKLKMVKKVIIDLLYKIATNIEHE